MTSNYEFTLIKVPSYVAEEFEKRAETARQINKPVLCGEISYLEDKYILSLPAEDQGNDKNNNNDDKNIPQSFQINYHNEIITNNNNKMIVFSHPIEDIQATSNNTSSVPYNYNYSYHRNPVYNTNTKDTNEEILQKINQDMRLDGNINFYADVKPIYNNSNSYDQFVKARVDAINNDTKSHISLTTSESIAEFNKKSIENYRQIQEVRRKRRKEAKKSKKAAFSDEKKLKEIILDLFNRNNNNPTTKKQISDSISNDYPNLFSSSIIGISGKAFKSVLKLICNKVPYNIINKELGGTKGQYTLKPEYRLNTN